MARYENRTGDRVRFPVLTHRGMKHYDVPPGGRCEGPAVYEAAFAREGLSRIGDDDPLVAAPQESAQASAPTPATTPAPPEPEAPTPTSEPAALAADLSDGDIQTLVDRLPDKPRRRGR